MSLAFTLKGLGKRVSFEMSRPGAVHRHGERFNIYTVMLRCEPVSTFIGLLDTDVHLWAEFFDDIAAQAIAWSGARHHESRGGIPSNGCILRMKAIGDGEGGVDLHVALWEAGLGGSVFAEGTIHLERRKLTGMAAAARRFFAGEPDAAGGSVSAT